MIEGLRADLDALRADFERELASAKGADTDEELQKLRSSFLGPKGRLTLLLRGLGQLPPEARPEAGRLANVVREALNSGVSDALSAFAKEKLARSLAEERTDLSLPGRRARPRGAHHPTNRVVADLVALFAELGFAVHSGPEVELDWYNFEALNFPPDHPARDMQDTFFVKPPPGRKEKELVLRTHTSPVQIRAMKTFGVPIRAIMPGRVYRCDQDATHSPMFHQIEGLCIDEGISFGHLKGVMQSFLNALFGTRAVRFRPSFFPFVEPGAEVDMQCVLCNGSGCRLCKQTGWIEILGAGMVHPNVLEAAGVDSERYTGFAFGLGIDRIAMLRHALDKLDLLFTSDVRFLEQI
ncbi:MAG: phenylalanine--tRNA ligase subunit alpha [Myxococcota bacterium]